MTPIEAIHHDHEELARVLKKHVGIRKIVEDLYPDHAHFIYELLQNAEDTGATETTFILSESSLIFKHNGRPFNLKDIQAITDIGDGTKASDEEKIGRFGIGFKSVFAYTDTPKIGSGDFAFCIRDLVLPSELPTKPHLENQTHFEFPFNNPKKPVQEAYAEVLAGLEELSENTLLFLSKIQSIAWKIQGKEHGEITRKKHSEFHIEMCKCLQSQVISSSHFLVFTHPVKDLETQNVALAFALELLPEIAAFDPAQPLQKQLKIVPANPAHVAVFFPAKKEVSGLRFHLHAPFVPELSRASIKESSANKPLFQQLAELATRSLFLIRDFQLLTADFLAVLPNNQDEIPESYLCIRNSILEAMKDHALTPTYSKSHAPATHLKQAKTNLKALLSASDLQFLVTSEKKPWDWAIAASQKNSNIDRFLSSLSISEWNMETFLSTLENHIGTRCFNAVTKRWTSGQNPAFLEWLGSKTEAWHQHCYALLYKELEPLNQLGRLKNLFLVRLSHGAYSTGAGCYFVTGESSDQSEFLQVAQGVYTSGKNQAEQESARKLLEAIGVQEIGESEYVKAILKERYTKASFSSSQNVHHKDMLRFIALVEQDSSHATLFHHFFIFNTEVGYGKPEQLYLDAPYEESGLSAYFEALKEESPQKSLSPCYLKLEISMEKFVHFAKKVGVQTRLQIQKTQCANNPDWETLSSVSGNYTHPLDVDFVIPDLETTLQNPRLQISRLLWKTLLEHDYASENVLQACYQRNGRSGTHYADSQLVHQLRKIAWIPQGKETFVLPTEAHPELLPEGFLLDLGWDWILAIQFAEKITQQKEKHRKKLEVAKGLGFSDSDSLRDATWFASLDPQERMQFKREFENRERVELPEHESRNPERRAAKVSEQAAEAPEHHTEQRYRSVAVGKSLLQKETRPYLRHQYSNEDGIMMCQICHSELPFKLKNDTYFFEAIPFISELNKDHFQNFLCLCPNHAAMFQYANNSKKQLQEDFLHLEGKELRIILAQKETHIYFTHTHRVDLKAVIQSEKK